MPFENQLPERLDAELRLAENLGVKPLRVRDAGFDEVINQGTIKWAVTEDNKLFVIPKFANGEEISHVVLTGGQTVLAAGEANIAGSEGDYYMIDISNYSGHFQPTPDSLEIGKEAFRQQGIDPTTAEEIIVAQ